MTHLVFILISIALLFGFFALTWYEAHQGMRFLAPTRTRLDRDVERVKFIFAHVDFGAFVREEARRIGNRIGHDSAHLSLQAVRAIERILTRLVRHLRTLHAVDIRPGENTREFVKTLSDFKGRLKETHPDVPNIH